MDIGYDTSIVDNSLDGEQHPPPMDLLEALAVDGAQPPEYWKTAIDAVHTRGIENFRTLLQGVLQGENRQALDTARKASEKLANVARKLAITNGEVQEQFSQLAEAYKHVLDEECANADANRVQRVSGKEYATAAASAHARAEAVREPLATIVQRREARAAQQQTEDDTGFEMGPPATATGDEEVPFVEVSDDTTDSIDPTLIGLDTPPEPQPETPRQPARRLRTAQPLPQTRTTRRQ